MLKWHYERNNKANRSFRKAIFAFSDAYILCDSVRDMRHNTNPSCSFRRNVEKRNDGVNRDCVVDFFTDSARNGKCNRYPLRALDTQGAIQTR